VELGRTMVEVRKSCAKKACALLTDMNQPLGRCIGNALEVTECIKIMGRKAKADDLMAVTFALAAEMLVMAGAAKNVADAKNPAKETGAAGRWRKLPR